jgi:hypothetical protein
MVAGNRKPQLEAAPAKLHEEMDKLNAAMLRVVALRAENEKRCAEVDAFYSRKRGYVMARPNKRASDTLHDVAQNNPSVRAMLRELQDLK